MTTAQFVSINKSDPLFFKYLWGKTDDRVKAIPVQSLNVGSADESITFELRPRSETQKPNTLRLISSVIKIKSFILILFPLFYVFSKNILSGRLNDPLSLSLAVLALIFFYAGLNIRNDILDYFSGFDRVNIPFSDKPILNGWLTAYQLSIISWILITMGLIFSIPVLVLQPEEIKVVVIVGILLITGQFFKRNSYKEKQLGELTLFLLMGVGVVSGFQVAAGAGIDIQVLSFGIFWGAVTLFLVHVNNFSHLITSTQAGIKNSMTLLGFDKAKIFLLLWWSLCIAVGFVLHLFFASLNSALIQTFLLVILSFRLFLKLINIRSPLGSDLVKIRQIAYQTFLGMVILFFMECLWQLGMWANWVP